MENKYKISVIVPVYNVEKYLEETIKSIIGQTIGFKNIQLILINDGSPDNSDKICLKYKKLYPENILYIEQKNSGVSNARNNAKNYATGELVTFLDSDDKWSKDSFKIVYDFWKKHEEIKVITCKMVFFDDRKGNHPLNYKYEKDRIIDIRRDYEFIQMSTCSAFFERETLKKYYYDSSIKYSEDTKIMNEILFDNYYMAVLKKPVYYYRRRKEQTSAIQGSVNNIDWYKVTPKEVYRYLFDLSINKFSRVIEYIQYLVAYEIGWRISVYNANLPRECAEEYSRIMLGLIKDIDLDIFFEQRKINMSNKLYLAHLKENIDIRKTLKLIDNSVKCEILDKNIRFIFFDSTYIKNGKMYFFGKFNTVLYDKDKLKLYVDDKKQKIEFYQLKKGTDVYSFNGDVISKYIGVKCVVDLDKVKEFGFTYDKGKEYMNLTFSNKCVINGLLHGNYYTFGNKMIIYRQGKFTISRNLIIKRFIREIKNIYGMLRNKKIKQLILRYAIKFTRPFVSHNIWLISDRINMANDNAEHFFKYLCKNKFKKVNPYFVITEESPDYKRMQKIGKVVSPNSLKYKLLFVHSKYIVSSHAEDYIINIFGRSNKYVIDLLKFKYAFLQHGIIKDDLSPWLNPNTKPMDMFVTSAKKEYESVLTYGYSKDIVKLTGLPRYDSLVDGNNPKKQILIQPTWRASLASKIDKKTGKRIYNPKFKETEFFNFYNGLINNKKLIEYLKKKDYRLRLCPHPNLIVQIGDFDKNEILDIENGEINYQKEFKEAAMLVTDYSSVFFDVAYLKKPVVYAHFDIDTFYEGQIYNKGYFEYEKDGFGPVTYDVESTVNSIIKIVEDGCKMEKEYKNRVNKFYYKFDNRNCERVYNEIIKLK